MQPTLPDDVYGALISFLDLSGLYRFSLTNKSSASATARVANKKLQIDDQEDYGKFQNVRPTHLVCVAPTTKTPLSFACRVVEKAQKIVITSAEGLKIRSILPSWFGAMQSVRELTLPSELLSTAPVHLLPNLVDLTVEMDQFSPKKMERIVKECPRLQRLSIFLESATFHLISVVSALSGASNLTSLEVILYDETFQPIHTCLAFYGDCVQQLEKLKKVLPPSLVPSQIFVGHQKDEESAILSCSIVASLLQAVPEEDLEIVFEYLDPNASYGRSPPIQALISTQYSSEYQIIRDKTTCVKLLLEKGANLRENFRIDSRICGLIHLLAHEQMSDLINMVVERMRASCPEMLELRDSDGFTPLHYVARDTSDVTENYEKTLEQLIKVPEIANYLEDASNTRCETCLLSCSRQNIVSDGIIPFPGPQMQEKRFFRAKKAQETVRMRRIDDLLVWKRLGANFLSTRPDGTSTLTDLLSLDLPSIVPIYELLGSQETAETLFRAIPSAIADTWLLSATVYDADDWIQLWSRMAKLASDGGRERAFGRMAYLGGQFARNPPRKLLRGLFQAGLSPKYQVGGSNLVWAICCACFPPDLFELAEEFNLSLTALRDGESILSVITSPFFHTYQPFDEMQEAMFVKLAQEIRTAHPGVVGASACVSGAYHLLTSYFVNYLKEKEIDESRPHELLQTMGKVASKSLRFILDSEENVSDLVAWRAVALMCYPSVNTKMTLEESLRLMQRLKSQLKPVSSFEIPLASHLGMSAAICKELKDIMQLLEVLMSPEWLQTTTWKAESSKSSSSFTQFHFGDSPSRILLLKCMQAVKPVLTKHWKEWKNAYIFRFLDFLSSQNLALSSYDLGDFAATSCLDLFRKALALSDSTDDVFWRSMIRSSFTRSFSTTQIARWILETRPQLLQGDFECSILSRVLNLRREMDDNRDYLHYQVLKDDYDDFVKKLVVLRAPIAQLSAESRALLQQYYPTVEIPT